MSPPEGTCGVGSSILRPWHHPRPFQTHHPWRPLSFLVWSSLLKSSPLQRLPSALSRTQRFRITAAWLQPSSASVPLSLSSAMTPHGLPNKLPTLDPSRSGPCCVWLSPQTLPLPHPVLWACWSTHGLQGSGFHFPPRPHTNSFLCLPCPSTSPAPSSHHRLSLLGELAGRLGTKSTLLLGPTLGMGVPCGDPRPSPTPAPWKRVLWWRKGAPVKGQGEATPLPGACSLFASLLGAIPLLPVYTGPTQSRALTYQMWTACAATGLSASRFQEQPLRSEFSHLALGWYIVDIQCLLIKLGNGAVSVFPPLSLRIFLSEASQYQAIFSIYAKCIPCT